MENGAGQNNLPVSEPPKNGNSDPKQPEKQRTKVAELEKRIAELEAEKEERKQVESVLRDSEWKFRTLMENLNIGVFRNTVEGGRIIQSNTAMARIFGYDSVRDFYEISVAELYTDIEDRRKFL
ncbi:MAG: PAS domain-containing protein, partial [Desulfopila sp.]|nr:PAS domain-containing protein [Desulfopila sp.]